MTYLPNATRETVKKMLEAGSITKASNEATGFPWIEYDLTKKEPFRYMWKSRNDALISYGEGHIGWYVEYAKEKVTIEDERRFTTLPSDMQPDNPNLADDVANLLEGLSQVARDSKPLINYIHRILKG